MRQIVVERLDLPLRLLDLFRAALEAEAEARATVEAYRDGELEELQGRLDAIFRYHPSHARRGTIHRYRRGGNPPPDSGAINRQGSSKRAAGHLNSLHEYFCELFGEEPRETNVGVYRDGQRIALTWSIDLVLPDQVGRLLYDFNLNPHAGDSSRDCTRPAEQKATRRKLVITGIQQRARPTRSI